MIFKRNLYLRLPVLGSPFVLLFLAIVFSLHQSSAQGTHPVLVSHPDSTRAIAIDSVTHQREPFAPMATVSFSTDGRTRVMLFAMNLRLQPGEPASVVTAEAQDGQQQVYPLTVEHVGEVPERPWATAIIVRLNEAMGDPGDVLIRVKYRGLNSNRVRLGIGHIGDGPPDDAGAIPTPGTEFPNAIVQNPTTTLTPDEVRTIIAQAVSASVQLARPVVIVITDREGSVIGSWNTIGAPTNTTIRSTGLLGSGLEGTVVPSVAAATSKAGTAALFSTGGNAFTTRTAGFIIQEHFPPGIDFRVGGPLYGVQFSSLPCGDIQTRALPLGLSADPGGIAIYKNGQPAGGIGVEGDGSYTVDRNPQDVDQPFEELIAASGLRGFEAPPLIRGDNILVDGIRLPYSNITNAPAPATIPFASLPGSGSVSFGPPFPPLVSQFVPAVVGGIAGEVDPRFFPFLAGSAPAGPNVLTAADVQGILVRAAQQANITRAAIRQPLGSNARVSIAVVDATGNVLGIFRSTDAPGFGFDVSVQKARTAAFFSNSNAGALLRAAGFGSFVDRAAIDGITLNGSIAMSTRAVGFLHRPFLPDGINNAAPGPFSTGGTAWSVFNVGLQLDLFKPNLASSTCSQIPNVVNGLQIFAGGVPLYRNGVLIGAIGISGDGIDQDDLIGAAGANGFAPPAAIRSDQFFVRGVRMPFLKFPRSPNL